MFESPSRVVLVLCLAIAAATARAGDSDDFDRLAEINRASIVMLAEQGIVPASLAAVIAEGIAKVVDEAAAPGASRSGDYLVFETRLLEVAGPEASRLHTGRSRQDIGSTSRRMALRDALLETLDALAVARQAVLDLAARHVETIVPAYTHGVQAQPTSLAHYLLAFDSAFGRDAERLQEVYARLNLSPLGAAALGTSGFAVDRERLADLLGFDAVVENSYDANLVASVDSKIEFANVLATSAIGVGQFMQNLHTQYHDPRPWLSLSEEITGVSSIMPQKRNPRPIDRVRSLATDVVGQAQVVTLNAHNTMSGMNDYRPGMQALHTAEVARDMYEAYADVLGHLVVDEARALEEVNADYSTMTEVADVLLRHANVPFRIGHHYASELTTFGRGDGMRPRDLSDEDLERIYEAATGDGLPVDVGLIRRALDPAAMVAGRRGLGGPQPAEVLRMLAGHRAKLAADARWTEAARGRLRDASERLDAVFRELY